MASGRSPRLLAAPIVLVIALVVLVVGSEARPAG